MSPVMEVTCSYKSMVRFGDTVQIFTRFEEYSGVKFYVSYEVRDKVTGELRTTGRSKHCFTDKNGKPISLKRSFPEIHEKFMEAIDD